MKFLCVLLLGVLSSLLQTTTATNNGNEPHMPPEHPIEDNIKEPEKPDDAEIICRCFRGRGDSHEANVRTEIISEEDRPRCQCFMRRGHEEELVKTDFVECAPKPCCKCGKETKSDICIEERTPNLCSCSANRIIRAPYPFEKSIATRPHRQCGCSRPDPLDCSCHPPEEKYVYCRPAAHYQR